MNFPRVPNGGPLEAGMFGFGFKGPDSLLDQCPPRIPLVPAPRFVVPIIPVDYGTGVLNFCSDDEECAVSVPYSTNFPARTSYPFVITCRDIKPSASKTFNVSLRFGPAGGTGARSVGRRFGALREEVFIPVELERPSPDWGDLSGRAARLCTATAVLYSISGKL